MICNAIATRRDKRRQAMLDAAGEVFSEKGFEAATLAEVVARSGGSLSTLYELFGNKAGLLAATVSSRCDQIAGVIDGAGIAAADTAEALREIGRYILEQMTDPDGIALFRIVVAEVPRHPELGATFYAAGPEAGRRIMGRFFARQAAQGSLDIDDPETAALHFFHMLLGDFQMRMLCGMPIDRADVATHLDRTVDAFLRLYAPRANDVARRRQS